MSFVCACCCSSQRCLLFGIKYASELRGRYLFTKLHSRLSPIVGVLLVSVGPVWVTMVWNATVVWMGVEMLRANTRHRAALALEVA